MMLQPIVYFTAAVWLLAFAAFGIYELFRRGTARPFERAIGFCASFLVAGLGAGAMIGGLYLVEELWLSM